MANKIVKDEIAPQFLAPMPDREFVPYTIEEKQNPITGQLTWSLHVRSDFYFDFLWLLRNKFLELNDAAAQ